MDCLKDYIGVAWCGEVTPPPSNIYINSLPGVSLKQINGLADDEQKTFAGVWDDIQTRAVKRIASAFYEQMQKRYKIFNIKHSYNLNRQIDLTSSSSPTDAFCGFIVEMRRTANDVIDSYLASISIQSLSFYASPTDAGDSVEVMIFDLTSGDKVFTDTITLVAGWNKVEVNEVFTNDFMDNSFQLFCCIDTSNIVTYSKEVDVENFTDCALRIKGASTGEIDNITSDDITEGNESYGLTGIISSVCLWDALVCSNKKAFESAWLYCLGVETMIENIYSERFNKYTTIGINRAKELVDPENPHSYIAIFEKEIKQACEGIYIDESDACIDCNALYQVQEQHP